MCDKSNAYSTNIRDDIINFPRNVDVTLISLKELPWQNRGQAKISHFHRMFWRQTMKKMGRVYAGKQIGR